MKPRALSTACVVLVLGLLGATPAHAQLPWRWFGSKTADKNLAGKSALPDPRRVTEVNVEIAWLADPITFPYYLEAHVNGNQQLEVIGYVPNKKVREHALRTAQVYSSLAVLDSMKEHPSLLVRPGQMSTPQLQSSVLSSLKVALPKQYQKFKVECGNDGKVIVTGPVNSHEEKIAVSHSLRRLHGCTSVQNLTSLPIELAQIPVTSPREKTVAGGPATQKPAETKAKSWMPWSTARHTTKQEPPRIDVPQKSATVMKESVFTEVANKNLLLKGPLLIAPLTLVKDQEQENPGKDPGVIKVELPAGPTNAAELSPLQLQKRILSACPKALSVEVTFPAAREVRILVAIRSAEDLNPTAEKVFALPELQNYRPDLQFKISSR